MRPVRELSSFPQQVRRRFGLGWRISFIIAALWLLTGLGLMAFVTKIVTTTESKNLTVVFAAQDRRAIDNSEGSDLSEHLVYSPGSQEDSDGQSITITSDAIQPIALTRMYVILPTGIFLMASTAGVATYLLVRRGLRPVRKFQDTINAVDASGLSTRVSLEGLEQELGELAAAFNDMMSRLESDFDQQSNFVSDAAHELRAPLAALRAHLEEVCQRPDATMEDYLALSSVQERMTQSLEKLITDLLILSAGGSIEHPEKITLGSLLEEVRQDLQHLAGQREVYVSLRGELELAVRGDELLLSRAFCNLLENGILYNRQGGELVVTAKPNSEWALIEVRDTGVGIVPEDQERVFDRLYRGRQARSFNTQGAGLGLAITKHVIERHGGGVEIQESTREGTTFAVRLPGICESAGTEQ